MESVSDNVAIINQQRNLGNMTGGRDARNFMVMKRLEALEESRLLRKAEKEAKAAAGVKSGGRFPLSRPKSVMDISSIAVLAQLKAKRKELRWRSNGEFYCRLSIAWAAQFAICGVAYWYAIICAISFGNNQTTAFIVSWVIAYGWTFAIVEPAQVLLLAGAPCLCDEETRLGRCCSNIRFVYNELCAP